MRTVSLVLLASAVVAGPAHGLSNFYDFSNYCGGGAFATCASIQLHTVQLPSGATIIQVWIRNLQGTHPAASHGPVAGWQVLIGSNQVRMWDHPRNAAYNGSLPVGSVGAGPDSDVEVFQEDYWDSFGYQEFLFYPLVVGCDVPSWWGQPGADGWQTCHSKGFTGWAVYQFSVPKAVYASQMYVHWTDTDGGELNCHTVGDGVAASPNCRHVPISTVPEPGTVGLVAIGLVGMGVFTLRRRRMVDSASLRG